jgi:hypothetical protein
MHLPYFFSREFWHSTLGDAAIFWAMITALATAALVIVGYVQLADLVRTRKSDFSERLYSSFFSTPEAAMLLVLIRYKLLILQDKVTFKVNQPSLEIIEQLDPDIKIEEERISAARVTRVILNPLEYVSTLVNHKAIDFSQAYLLFSSIVTACWKNEEIRKFIMLKREEISDALYQQAELFYEKVKRYKGKRIPLP